MFSLDLKAENQMNSDNLNVSYNLPIHNTKWFNQVSPTRVY